MNTRRVDKKCFISELNSWTKKGRSLISLLNVETGKAGLSLSIIDTTNTENLVLNISFRTYSELMGFYGELMDSVLLPS